MLAHPVHEGLPVAGRVEAPGPALDAQVREHEGAQGVVQLLGVHLAAAVHQQGVSSCIAPVSLPLLVYQRVQQVLNVRQGCIASFASRALQLQRGNVAK